MQKSQQPTFEPAQGVPPPKVRDPNPSKEIVTDRSATPDGDMRGINRASAEAKRISRLKRMEEYFAEQPKERVRIRKEHGEQQVMINSYPFLIQAGEYVKVPVDVADILRDADLI